MKVHWKKDSRLGHDKYRLFNESGQLLGEVAEEYEGLLLARDCRKLPYKNLGEFQTVQQAQLAILAALDNDDKRSLGDRFHIEHGEVVKTSTGETVPRDEPVFLIRARDHLAIAALTSYMTLARSDGCTDELLVSLHSIREQFIFFARNHKDRMKQPGVTGE